MKTLLDEQIAAHTDGISNVLAPYEPADTVRTWHTTIRAVEEFINVPRFGIKDDEFLAQLLAFPLDERLISSPARLCASRLRGVRGRRYARHD